MEDKTSMIEVNEENLKFLIKMLLSVMTTEQLMKVSDTINELNKLLNTKE